MVCSPNGVSKTFTALDPERNEVFVQFKIAEEIDGVPLQVSAKVEAPVIWIIERGLRLSA